jgi:hypothetical protein
VPFGETWGVGVAVALGEGDVGGEGDDVGGEGEGGREGEAEGGREGETVVDGLAVGLAAGREGADGLGFCEVATSLPPCVPGPVVPGTEAGPKTPPGASRVARCCEGGLTNSEAQAGTERSPRSEPHDATAPTTCSLQTTGFGVPVSIVSAIAPPVPAASAVTAAPRATLVPAAADSPEARRRARLAPSPLSCW